jgi:hypothetical protein
MANKGKNIASPAPRWSPKIRQWVIDQRAASVDTRSIYNEVTHTEFEDKNGFPRLDPAVHSFVSFRHRVYKLPRDAILEAREEWKNRMADIRWASELARVKGLSDLVEKVYQAINEGDNILDHTEALGQLRLMMEQIRKEEAADADRLALALSGGDKRILLANPKRVELDGDLMTEMLLTFRQELGGLHTIDFSSFSEKELDDLIEAVTAARTQKRLAASEEIDYEVVDDEDNEERGD